MKKFLLLAVLMCATMAHAHILLTTPYSITGPTGIAISSVPAATATSKTYDWVANIACISYSFGTVTSSSGIDSAFVVTPGAPVVMNCLNLGNGSWVATSNTGQGITILNSGILTGASLTGAITVYTGPLTALRDAADYFAMGTFLPGTQPALWGAGDL
jgi:hypothetical protein